MSIDFVEHLPQVLGAAAAFMLGWACGDWVRARQSRKETTPEAVEDITATGPIEPITAGQETVTKVNTVSAVAENTPAEPPEPEHAIVVGPESAQAVKPEMPPHMAVELAALPEAEVVEDVAGRDEGVLIARPPSVRVMDSLVVGDN